MIYKEEKEYRMKKYLVVTDTTSSIDKELAKRHGISLISLSVLIDGQEYKDQVDISTGELYQKLNEGYVPSTSQPNQGYVQKEMEKWKSEDYEAIVIVTCSSDLSGTWSGFHLAKNTLEMENVHIIDTRQIGAPVLDMALYVKEKLDAGKTIEEILVGVEQKIPRAFSFLYPDNFTQLKRGGRLSPAAAGIASLLKMRALLYLKEDGTCVEKFTMTRTETKIIKAIIDKFHEIGVNSKEYKLYISHANNIIVANKFKEILQQAFTNIDCDILELPAVLTCHGGIGCISIHSTYK